MLLEPTGTCNKIGYELSGYVSTESPNKIGNIYMHDHHVSLLRITVILKPEGTRSGFRNIDSGVADSSVVELASHSKGHSFSLVDQVPAM